MIDTELRFAQRVEALAQEMGMELFDYPEGVCVGPFAAEQTAWLELRFRDPRVSQRLEVVPSSARSQEPCKL
jgi:hypothetical protein